MCVLVCACVRARARVYVCVCVNFLPPGPLSVSRDSGFGDL